MQMYYNNVILGQSSVEHLPVFLPVVTEDLSLSYVINLLIRFIFSNYTQAMR